MKILQLIYESEGSPFGFGGAGVRAYEIYRRLAERHEITMACMRYPGAEDRVVDSIRHVHLGTESRSLLKSVAAYTAAASRFVARQGSAFDVIVENFLPTTPFFSRYRTDTPVLLQVQGVLEGNAFRKFSPWLGVPMALVERFYPPRYAHYLFVSPVTRDKVLAGRSSPPRIAAVVGNGIGPEFAGAPEPGGSGQDLLFFSRLDEYTKGLDLLMAAFAELAPRYPEMRLVLAGTEFTPFARLLERVPARYRERVRYAGFVTGEEKINLLGAARIVVLPSRHESAPVSLLEAAASGRPLVVSDIPELAYVHEEGIGRVFEAGRADGLAGAIADLWEDDGERTRCGRRGAAYAGRFQWDALAGAFEEVLAAVAASGPPV